MFLFTVICLSFVFILYMRNKYDYWAKKGIKSYSALPIVGNFGKVMFEKESNRQCFENIYKQYPEERIVGVYCGLQPVLLIRDPELIKQMLINDFHHFQDTGINLTNNKLSYNLFEAKGKIWRLLRQKLTPVFTLKKLKYMVPIIQKCAEDYMNHVEHIVENNIDLEIKYLKSKYALKVVGSCFFGLNLNTFADKEDDFFMMGKKLSSLTHIVRSMLNLKMIIPSLAKKIDRTADIYNFFLNLITEVIKQRHNEPEEIKKKDFIDYMIELKEKEKDSQGSEDNIIIDNTMIAAQAMTFYAASFDASSSVMAFILHELAFHQDIQDKVYVDISETVKKYNGEISCETIREMVYLEMVFEETLRKNSVCNLLRREATSDYKIPGSNVIITKGTRVYISVSGLHKDKKYFPNPEKFNPDNFSKENKKSRPDFNYIPFGIGPRQCIGRRFAEIMSMIGIIAFLMKFKVEPSSRSKYEYEDDPNCVNLSNLHGIWLKISKR